MTTTTTTTRNENRAHVRLRAFYCETFIPSRRPPGHYHEYTWFRTFSACMIHRRPVFPPRPPYLPEKICGKAATNSGPYCKIFMCARMYAGVRIFEKNVGERFVHALTRAIFCVLRYYQPRDRLLTSRVLTLLPILFGRFLSECRRCLILRWHKIEKRNARETGGNVCQDTKKARPHLRSKIIPIKTRRVNKIRDCFSHLSDARICATRTVRGTAGDCEKTGKGNTALWISSKFKF